MWIDKNGYVYVGDRQGIDPVAPIRPVNTHWDQPTQAWKPLINQEEELDIIQQAAKFILDNLSVPVEKQAERDQLKTKLNTKRGIGS